jgi:hypothetical protein
MASRNGAPRPLARSGILARWQTCVAHDAARRSTPKSCGSWTPRSRSRRSVASSRRRALTVSVLRSVPARPKASITRAGTIDQMSSSGQSTPTRCGGWSSETVAPPPCRSGAKAGVRDSLDETQQSRLHDTTRLKVSYPLRSINSLNAGSPRIKSKSESSCAYDRHRSERSIASPR